jgi:hypothetical protein
MARPCAEHIARGLARHQKDSDTGYRPALACGKKSRVNAIRHLLAGAVVIVGLSCIGCASHAPKSGNGRYPSFNVIRLYNDSPAEIYDIELDAGGLVTAIDKLPAEHSPTRDRGIRPDTQSAEIRWQTADGTREQQTVQIAGKLPSGFHGVIVLKLKPTGNVEMELVRYDDLK